MKFTNNIKITEKNTNIYHLILLNKTKHNLKQLDIPKYYRNNIMKYLKDWITNKMFHKYKPHTTYLIEKKQWNLLINCFYKLIPFGTGGRRGLIGIGPNRINNCTSQILAQSHSQYLIKKFTNKKIIKKGIVLAYDTRNHTLKNNKTESKTSITSYKLAKSTAKVYAANGIKVYLFNTIKSTPMLSFAIRYLKAAGGCMFSASHNQSQYNGEKIYNDQGNQIISPVDQAIINEMSKNTHKIKKTKIKKAINNGIIEIINKKIDNIYYNKIKSNNTLNKQKIRILYSPFHGTGLTSVYHPLKELKYNICLDKTTSHFNSNFENISFQIPNPENHQSFSTLINNANNYNTDIIIATDPDADRIGIMIHHKNYWKFLNGHQIGIILTEYSLKQKNKNKKKQKKTYIIIKTETTTSLIKKITKKNNSKCIANLPVGFKYIGNELNKLKYQNLENNFLLGIEESHGFLINTYCKDKDASESSIWLSELTAKLKQTNLTLSDYLNLIYLTYGYCYNNLVEIKINNFEKNKKIDKLIKHFQKNRLNYIGFFKIKQKIEKLNYNFIYNLQVHKASSHSTIIFTIKNFAITKKIKLTIRPSGTESKLKIYIEILAKPCNFNKIEYIKTKLTKIGNNLKQTFLTHCHNIIYY